MKKLLIPVLQLVAGILLVISFASTTNAAAPSIFPTSTTVVQARGIQPFLDEVGVFVSALIVGLATLVLGAAGFLLLTSRGNTNQIGLARTLIIGVFSGLAIILLAGLLLYILLGDWWFVDKADTWVPDTTSTTAAGGSASSPGGSGGGFSGGGGSGGGGGGSGAD